MEETMVKINSGVRVTTYNITSQYGGGVQSKKSIPRLYVEANPASIEELLEYFQLTYYNTLIPIGDIKEYFYLCWGEHSLEVC